MPTIEYLEDFSISFIKNSNGMVYINSHIMN